MQIESVIVFAISLLLIYFTNVKARYSVFIDALH